MLYNVDFENAGDRGYPLQPWLMTPVMATVNAAEENYNMCHARARNEVEMCNGRLKNKFRCLHRHRCLHYKPIVAAKIILSCCTLYNMFYDALRSGRKQNYLLILFIHIFVFKKRKVILKLEINELFYFLDDDDDDWPENDDNPTLQPTEENVDFSIRKKKLFILQKAYRQ